MIPSSSYCCFVFTSSTIRENRKFHVVSVQRWQMKCTKMRDARAKLLFCQSKTIYFLPFSLLSLSSLLKRDKLASKPGFRSQDSGARTRASTRARGPFLESPAKFSGPKSNIQIEIQTKRAWVLASKLLHFVSLTDSFIMLNAKLLKPQSSM